MILPPLNALRAFEACATIGTFRGAADRLNVTPSAISHQIRQLEELLGVPLFERSTRQVRLTGAGEGYLPSVREALRLIEAATARLTRRAEHRRLTVSAAPSHAMGWLMPRIPRFQLAHPGIELRLDMSIDWVDLRVSDVDVALRYSASGHFPGLVAHHLFDEVIVPVCRPDLLVEHCSGPEALLALPLIEVSYRSGQWSHWFQAAGIDSPVPDPGLVVDYDTVAAEAALDGLGVALVPRPLVTRQLAMGRLRIPFPVQLEGLHSACHLVYPAERRDDPDIASFYTWLKGELARED